MDGFSLNSLWKVWLKYFAEIQILPISGKNKRYFHEDQQAFNFTLVAIITMFAVDNNRRRQQ